MDFIKLKTDNQAIRGAPELPSKGTPFALLKWKAPTGYKAPRIFAGSMPFCVELDNLKDTDAPIHQPAAMLVAAD